MRARLESVWDGKIFFLFEKAVCIQMNMRLLYVFMSYCVQIFHVVDGVSPQTSQSTGFPPAFQPVMWSTSALIKLTVVPNSNQKGRRSVPDCVSCCHTQSVHVRGHFWRKKKINWKAEKKRWKACDYIYLLFCHLQTKTLPMRETSEFEKWAHKYEMMRQRGICGRQYIQMRTWWKERWSLLDLETQTMKEGKAGK